MWDIPRLYITACSNSLQLVPFQPIAISILFHHYKELKECISEVEQVLDANSRATNSSSKKIDWLAMKKEEQKEKVEMSATLDGYFIHMNADCK